ncbi:hypothetical protein Tco_0263118, partial [Tanacetum coccineum]
MNNAPVWKDVENILSFVPRPAYVPTRRPFPDGWSFPAGSRNRPTSVPAGRSFPASRPFPTGWHNPAARPMTRPKSHYFQQFNRPGSYNQMAMDEGRWGTAVKTSGFPLSIPVGSINQAAGGSAVPSTPSSSVVEPVHAEYTTSITP